MTVHLKEGNDRLGTLILRPSPDVLNTGPAVGPALPPPLLLVGPVGLMGAVAAERLVEAVGLSAKEGGMAGKALRPTELAPIRGRPGADRSGTCGANALLIGLGVLTPRVTRVKVVNEELGVTATLRDLLGRRVIEALGTIGVVGVVGVLQSGVLLLESGPNVLALAFVEDGLLLIVPDVPNRRVNDRLGVVGVIGVVRGLGAIGVVGAIGVDGASTAGRNIGGIMGVHAGVVARAVGTSIGDAVGAAKTLCLVPPKVLKELASPRIRVGRVTGLVEMVGIVNNGEIIRALRDVRSAVGGPVVATVSLEGLFMKLVI